MKRGTRYNAEQIRQQESDCAELRILAVPIREIAAKLSLATDTVQKRVDAYFEHQPTPDLAKYRALTGSRYEVMFQALAPGILAGDPQAISAGCTVLIGMRKLLGLDAAIQIEATVLNISPEDIELRGLLQQVEAGNSVIRQERKAIDQ